jgi:two-component system response regulator
MSPKIILLVEDNADEERLTLRAFKREKILNEIVVARDGGEALDYLFATGAHQGRSHDRMPQVVLLDLKLPKIDGLGVLTRMRADERTRFLPVVVLSSSREDKDLAAARW